MKFDERVYEVLKKVPEGRVTTYKAIADRMETKAYQAIGQALKRNPNAPEVPCHRVVASDGSINGYSGEREGEPVRKKVKLLKEEGVKVENGRVKDFENKLWD